MGRNLQTGDLHPLRHRTIRKQLAQVATTSLLGEALCEHIAQFPTILGQAMTAVMLAHCVNHRPVFVGETDPKLIGLLPRPRWAPLGEVKLAVSSTGCEVSGFSVTDQMLDMIRLREIAPAVPRRSAAAPE